MRSTAPGRGPLAVRAAISAASEVRYYPWAMGDVPSSAEIAQRCTDLTSRTVPPIMRRDPHAIPAAGRAAPAPRMVLGGVVKKDAASGVGASFYEREIAVTEQIAR